MASIREEPFFNLKAVVRQTGIKPDTLRAWERRYGLPMPERSDGGHRLYSRRDIDTICWLTARQREGVGIKQAVKLWRELEAAGHDPLAMSARVPLSFASSTMSRVGGETLAQLRDEWVAACLAYDEQRSERVLAQAFALYSPETVCLELLQRAISEIGDRWYQGEVTAQQEHFASELAMRRLEALMAAVPGPTRMGRILAACPPQEHHVFGLLILTLLLRRQGWEVVYLGADVPEERLERTVAATRPDLVILAAQQLHTAATLLGVAQLLQRESFPVAYGGLIFNLVPALRHRIPGHFLAEGVEAALQAVEALMTAPRPRPSVDLVPDNCVRARDHFQNRLSLIEAQLAQTVESGRLSSSHLSMAKRELARNIGAALTLGDLGLLGTDIGWVECLVRNHGLATPDLYEFLEAYYQAAKAHMDERGEPIVTWLETLLRGLPPG